VLALGQHAEHLANTLKMAFSAGVSAVAGYMQQLASSATDCIDALMNAFDLTFQKAAKLLTEAGQICATGIGQALINTPSFDTPRVKR
jgi:hypothetical protein